MGEANLWNGRGIRHLLELFNEIVPTMEVLAVRFPINRSCGAFQITGEIPVVRTVAAEGKSKAGREIQVIAIDHTVNATPQTFDANRRLDYLLTKYGLPLELRRRFEHLAEATKCFIYLPRIPKLAELPVERDGLTQALKWSEWVVEAIGLGHFYPRPGGKCLRCGYSKACNASYVSDRSLRLAKETTDAFRRQLDGG
jgi:hypothetical protein